MKLKPDSPIFLPIYRDNEGNKKFIALVPEDIVRNLPLVKTWADLSKIIEENQNLRDRVNVYLSGIIKPTVVEKKRAVRSAALENSYTFDLFLKLIKEHTDYYDPNEYALGYYR